VYASLGSDGVLHPTSGVVARVQPPGSYPKHLRPIVATPFAPLSGGLNSTLAESATAATAPVVAAEAIAATGNIAGTVRDDSNNPIPNVYVTAYVWNITWWEWVNGVFTDSSGNYGIGSLADGTYRICFSPGAQYVYECYDNAPDVNSATDVAVGAIHDNVNAQLALAAHIKGKVTDAQGNPISDVGVSAYTWNTTYQYWMSVNGGWATTGADGLYDVGGLAGGTYRVCFSSYSGQYVDECYNNAADVNGAMDLSVAAEATRSNVNAQLALAAHIKGKVTDAQGNPLSDVGVSAYTWNATYQYWVPVGASATTGADGLYDVGGLAGGTYRVCFSSYSGQYVDECYNNAADVNSATDLSVAAGATRSNVNAQLALAAHIKGKVTDAQGNPLSDVGVSAYTGDATYQYSVPVGGWATTGADGLYDVGGLAGGTYRVCFFNYSGQHVDECYNNAADVNSATDLSVAAGATRSNVNAQLALAAHIKGKVTDAQGNPISDVGVLAYTWNATYQYWVPVIGGWAPTGADGRYDVGGLVGGTYRVCFSSNSGQYVDECYNNAAGVDGASDIQLQAGATIANIDAQLADSGTDTDGDGIPDATDPDDDNDGIADWADPAPLDPNVGRAPVSPAATAAQVNQSWTSIDAPSGYLDAVVIAGPPTYHGADPGVVRLRNVSDTGFELRFEEWDYRARQFNDTVHAKEDIPYLVLEPGRHTMSDGSVWEVGTFSLGGTGAWQGELFSAPFGTPPRLFLTVQTNNGGQAVSVRVRNVTAGGFEAALFEEEALMDGHATETIGYLAIESPTGGGLLDLDGVQGPYLLQSLTSDERWTPVLSQRLKVEEEKSKDDEVDHGEETIDVLALGDQLLAQQVTSNGGDTTALRRLEPTADAPLEWGMLRGINQDWQVLPFAKAYTHPVLVAKPVSSNGGDPGVIRIKDLTGDHAQLRYQEWDYLDGIHGAREDLFYLVSEAGSYQLGGLDIEADRLTTNKLGRAGQWEPISLDSLFFTDPAVFASVMSYNGADAVTTRIRNLAPTGFELAMDEQESKSDGHANETLGWIAIEQGSATTAEGRKLQVFFKQLNDQRTVVPYPAATAHRYPTAITDVDSTYGADPVVLRYVNPTNLQIELRLEEEKSKDAETSHALEDVGVLVGE
jgi:protocatechuate 3,4-dioxygenase beta subunit